MCILLRLTHTNVCYEQPTIRHDGRTYAGNVDGRPKSYRIELVLSTLRRHNTVEQHFCRQYSITCTVYLTPTSLFQILLAYWFLKLSLCNVTNAYTTITRRNLYPFPFLLSASSVPDFRVPGRRNENVCKFSVAVFRKTRYKNGRNINIENIHRRFGETISQMISVQKTYVVPVTSAKTERYGLQLTGSPGQ